MAKNILKSNRNSILNSSVQKVRTSKLTSPKQQYVQNLSYGNQVLSDAVREYINLHELVGRSINNPNLQPGIYKTHNSVLDLVNALVNLKDNFGLSFVDISKLVDKNANYLRQIYKMQNLTNVILAGLPLSKIKHIYRAGLGYGTYLSELKRRYNISNADINTLYFRTFRDKDCSAPMQILRPHVYEAYASMSNHGFMSSQSV